MFMAMVYGNYVLFSVCSVIFLKTGFPTKTMKWTRYIFNQIIFGVFFVVSHYIWLFWLLLINEILNEIFSRCWRIGHIEWFLCYVYCTLWNKKKYWFMKHVNVCLFIFSFDLYFSLPFNNNNWLNCLFIIVISSLWYYYFVWRLHAVGMFVTYHPGV